MAGTKIGGKRAAKTNKKRYGADHYAKIAPLANEAWIENGRKPKGFAAMDRAKVAAAGRLGGKASKRNKNTK